ncbi:MAG: CRISPR-associated helicase Cas3' [Lentisphaeria bacterium]|jgi:CRISPR-associated endonuclease/helicase Cas3
MEYLARENQLLIAHIENTAKIAKEFADVFGIGNTAYFTGLLHDQGKFTIDFQHYLSRSLRGENARRGEVIHALQGAKSALDAITDPVVSDIMGAVIATHHNELYDIIAEGERTLTKKLHINEKNLHYEEVISAFHPEIKEETITAEIYNACKISCSKNLDPFFMLHLMTKVLYSCLVDADRCDAAGLLIDKKESDWSHLIQQLEAYLDGFTKTTDLDLIRNKISMQCKESGSRPKGIYTLSVPTGGGKTLSSLRFALEHAKTHGLKRIIYVIPYLSILDQTADTIRDIIGNEYDQYVLEHHSDIDPVESDEEDEHRKLLTSRWDSRIILTTMVQFLETIYSNKASKLRKFHNMSEAVLIFDEIQALPVKCVRLFNNAVNFLHVFGNSTAVLCTATQPHLNKVKRPIILSDNHPLVTLTRSDQKVFERVRLEDRSQSPMSYVQIAELAKAQLDAGKSTLIILNTKGDARGVYKACKSLDIGVEQAFLTTDMCPAHRIRVLDKLKESLKSQKPTLCVATQLIEAGVNISFGCVIRAKAGLDSIIQAAGRCNRNNEWPEEPQAVLIIDVEDEKLSRLPEIYEGKMQTSRVFREKNNVDKWDAEAIESALKLFNDYYFFARENEMDYVVEKSKDGIVVSTIFDLLGSNRAATCAFQQHTGMQFRGLPAAFKTGSDAFSVIEGGQTGIIVPYDKAMEYVGEFATTFNPLKKAKILKSLQKYTVNVYSSKLSGLLRDGAVKIIDNVFYLLSNNWYDPEKLGLLPEPRLEFLYK